MPNAHARFGGSNASRWINCPGSTREIALSRPRDTNLAAEEGRAAHFIAESCLRRDLDARHYFGQWISADGILEKRGVRPEFPGSWFEVDDEMVDGVSMYVDQVRGIVDSTPGAELYIEQEVYPVPELKDVVWGTADAVIVEPWGDLIVYDFKYGKRVLVMPQWNDQGMFYSLGALLRYSPGVDDVAQVRVGIVQPRRPDSEGETIREWATPPRRLLSFADQVRNAVRLSDDPQAPLIPGDHCTFCPAELTCPALEAMRRTEILANVPDDIELLEEATPESIGARFPDVNDGAQIRRARELWRILKSWGRRVDEITMDAAQRNVPGLGLKIIQGLGHRAFIDEDAVAAGLLDLGLTTEDITHPSKLLSPARIENALRALGWTGKERKAWVDERTTRPLAAPKLVADTDSRPAIPSTMDLLETVGDIIDP